jgi:hypothetical protein
LAVLGLQIMIPAIFSVYAAESNNSLDSYEEAEKLATIIFENLIFDEGNSQYHFYYDEAIEAGLDKETADQLESYYTNLSKEEALQIYEETTKESEGGIHTQVVVSALLIAAGKILAKAGLAWMAKKLLDWGSAKFCKTYKNSNSVTKNVCNLLGE